MARLSLAPTGSARRVAAALAVAVALAAGPASPSRAGASGEPFGPRAPDDAAARSRSPFGLNTDFVSRPGSPEELQRLADSGARWVREPVRWDRVGGPDGPFDVTRARDALLRLSALGVTPLVELGHGPVGWVANRPPTHVPLPLDLRQVDQWSAYVRTASRSVAGSAAAYEVWPRANHGASWQPRPSASDYLLLLLSAHEEIDATDPGADVVLGAVAGLDRVGDVGNVTVQPGRTWLPEVLSRGGAEAIDAVAFHPDGSTPEAVTRSAHEALRVVATEAPGTPLWVVDVGWPLGSLARPARSAGVTAEELQAAWLVRAHVQLLALSGVDRIFWRSLRERGTDGDFSLLGYGGDPRPAFAAYRTMTGLLAGAVLEGQPLRPDLATASGDGVSVLRFRRGPETVAVLWRTSGGRATRTVALRAAEGASAEIVGVDGRRQAATVEDGRLWVSASEVPVYVVLGPPAAVRPAAGAIRVAALMGGRSSEQMPALLQYVSELGADAATRGRSAVASAAGLLGSGPPVGRVPPSGGAAGTSPAVDAARRLVDGLAYGDSGPPLPGPPIVRAAAVVGGASLRVVLAAAGARLDAGALRYDVVGDDGDGAVAVRVHGRLRLTQVRLGRRDTASIPVDLELRWVRAGNGWALGGWRPTRPCGAGCR